MITLRLPSVIPVLSLLACVFTAGSLVGAASSASGQIGFYSNLANSINDPVEKNPPVVRPSRVFLTEDGSNVLINLRWTGWGTSVARATGVDSASTGVPSMATAPRIKRPAQLVLSRPARFLGHEVYSCYRLTIRGLTNANGLECLARLGNGQYVFSSVSQAKPNATPTASTVRFFTPSHNILCEMFDNGTSGADVTCAMQTPSALATLAANGHVTICQHQGLKCKGNLDEGPSFHQLSYGSSANAGRFRCTSAITGVTCVVAATGKGFFISRQSTRTTR